MSGLRSDQDTKIPQPLRLTQASSGYLDGIRALAAFTVMFGHCRGLYFVDFGHISSGNATFLVRAIYLITAFGHQSVMIFFVLSGFFVSSSILRSLSKPKWSWWDYAIDRGSRLYIVLLPGLCLGLLWDLLGSHLYNQTEVYSAPLVPFGSEAVVSRLTLPAFIGSLLFLQTRFTTVFGSNGPLWSLFNKFWYYVFFPAIVATILSLRRRLAGAALKSLALVAVTFWILKYQLGGFLVWMSGCAVALTSNYWRFPHSSGWL